ncbi:MAG: hypothetical protein WDM71_11105 [Ferruginibacter sp.]
MRKLFFIFLLLAGLMYLSSCYKDNLSELTPSSGVTIVPCDTSGIISYSAQVIPIMQVNCGINSSCHSSSNISGYNLSTYTGVNAVAQNGNLVSAINWTGSVAPMPQNAPQMNSCNITLIEKWVNAGHLNN